MSVTDAPDRVPVFDFMVVRAPAAVAPPVLRRDYIHDDYLIAWSTPMTHVSPGVDLYSVEHFSKVGKLVYEKVFCSTPKAHAEAMEDLLDALLGLLTPRQLVCEGSNGSSADSNGRERLMRSEAPVGAEAAETSEAPAATATDVLEPEPAAQAAPAPSRLLLRDLERHAYIKRGGYYYLLPDKLEQLQAVALVPQLSKALPILESELRKLDKSRLLKRLEALFDGQALHAVVFSKGQHSPAFIETKRALFDALYLLYVLRRWASVDLYPTVAALRGLHALEALAMDRVYGRALAGPISPAERDLLVALARLFPGLEGWNFKTAVPGFPLIPNEAALEAYLSATPVVHPIFARLFRYAKPFNEIRPLGIGDLKVVKQWLKSYVPGEICDVHNVMKGEQKERVHRRLEKTDEAFAFTSAQEEESTKDTQSTGRFELKREAEQVLKSDLNVNANASFSYDNKPIVATVSGGFTSARSDTQTDKMAQNFSHDVVSKAVTRIESRTTQQRSVTKIFETEETNKHGYSAPNDHISGIYRWIDKRYTAQLFNYGKRLMFEFVIPEPAAFFVESRLRAFESSLDYPQPPKPPAYRTLNLGFAAKDINEKKFNELRQQYDLAEHSFPVSEQQVVLVSQDTQQAYFYEKDLPKRELRYAKSHTCRLNSIGYQVDRLHVHGDLRFHNKDEADDWNRNKFGIQLNGQLVYWNTAMETALYHNPDIWVSPPGGPFLLTGDSIELVLLFQDIWRYALVISAELSLSPAAFESWQIGVYNAISAQASQEIADANRELKLAYESRMAEYRSRIAELKATAVNDLLQGRSEAVNRELILTELRRQCLAMLAKEFDADPTDDLLTDLETMGTRPVAYRATRLEVKEGPKETQVRFTTTTQAANYPTMKLDKAGEKGRYVQFLEQAFEWQQLAFLFYPYFWTTPPKWVELTSRSDATDPTFGAFLEAGSVRVLVAVTPAYDDAVLHFLATREPWEGGAAPVIGDPLYLPLYQELRKQQDDLYGATPEGDPWEFTLPTSLVYIHGSSTPLPELAATQSPGP
jgi:hypothetical protein